MKAKDIKLINGVKFNGGKSYRFVLKEDGLGFAMMETRIKKGGPYKWHYKNHQEVCYCISGKGLVTDLVNGETFKIEKGVSYFADDHRPHTFIADTNVVLISVFNPPLRGDETHDENGIYN